MAPREHAELAAIYVTRGLDAELANQVATQLMAKDPLGAHARDELGLYEGTRANPLQAALSSTVAFSGGALPPLLLAIWVPAPDLALSVGGVSLVLLAGLGGLAARLGGSSTLKGALRVTFWGVFAMAATALVGQFLGVAA